MMYVCALRNGLKKKKGILGNRGERFVSLLACRDPDDGHAVKDPIGPHSSRGTSVKKIFALMIAVCLAATIGCGDSKTTAKPSSGTVTNTNTVTAQKTATETKTIVNTTVEATRTNTVQKTVTVDATKTPEKPKLPDPPPVVDPEKKKEKDGK
jgi:hypothetical protein